MPKAHRARQTHACYLIKAVLLCLLISQTVLASLPQRVIEGELRPSLAPIIETASPAVVNISTYTIQRRYNPLLQSPFFRHFFDLPDNLEEERTTQSAGSGVIVDAQAGYILTNHHVISGSNDIEVRIHDGRAVKARLVGSDKKVDIALLQIDAKGLTALPLADSRELKVGDFVIAIGNPFGLSQTVTSGIVSALGRNGLGIQGYEDFIQTDASINPGNSGGALIDLNGRLVGINSAIIAPAGGNVGIGFAIPADVTKAIMSQLISYGEVKRGGIGASFQDLTPELAEAFSLTTFQGAVVSSIKPGSAAELSGIKVGDIIIAANDRRVANASDMHNRIGLSPLGEILNLDIIRQGNKIKLSTEITAIPVPEAKGIALSPYLAGAHLKELIPPDQESSVGILVEMVEPNSTVARIGLQTGDIIFGINRSRIRTLEQLADYLANRAPQAFRIRRGYEDLILYVR